MFVLNYGLPWCSSPYVCAKLWFTLVQHVIQTILPIYTHIQNLGIRPYSVVIRCMEMKYRVFLKGSYYTSSNFTLHPGRVQLIAKIVFIIHSD